MEGLGSSSHKGHTTHKKIITTHHGLPITETPPHHMGNISQLKVLHGIGGYKVVAGVCWEEPWGISKSSTQPPMVLNGGVMKVGQVYKRRAW